MTISVTDDRARFEAWAKSEGFTVEAFDKDKEKCFWPQTQIAWRSWQAALRSQGKAVSVEKLKALPKHERGADGDMYDPSGIVNELDLWVYWPDLTAIIGEGD